MNGGNSSDGPEIADIVHELDRMLSSLSEEFRNEFGADDHKSVSVDRSANKLQRQLRTILAFDDESRMTALEAVMSALSLGASMAARPKIFSGVIRLLHNEQTRLARAARKRDDIQEIIAREANDLWKRQPSLKGKPTPTAKEICDAVVAAIEVLPTPPKGWETAGVNAPKERCKFIEAIRKRVSRLKGTG